MSDEMRHDWSELDERLDRAIDALNDEQSPRAFEDDPVLAELIDTARLARRLREPDEPAEPDAEFPARLIELMASGPAFPDPPFIMPNGHRAESLEPTPITRRSRFVLVQLAAVIRAIGVCVLAGMLAGALVGGVGGRVAMRLSGAMYERAHPGQVAITESSDAPVGQITFDGTVELIVSVALFQGVAGGLLFFFVMPWLPRRRLARGLVFAALLLALAGIVIDSGNRDFRRLGSPVLNVAMFAALVAAYGWVVAFAVERFDRGARERTPPRDIRSFVAQLPVYAFGLLGLLVTTLFVVFGTVEAVAGLATLETGTLLSLVTAVVALLLPAARILVAVPRGQGPAWLPAAGRSWRVGFGALAVLIALGAFFTLRSIVEILGG
jgi:hypothetical protein